MMNRELKNKKETEELLFKSIIVSINDMGRFEQKEMKRKRPSINTWYDWLINYILEPIRKIVGGFKDKVASIFKTNTPKDYGKQTAYGKGKKSSKPKTQRQADEDTIIRNIRNLFKQRRKMKQLKTE